LCQIFSVAWIGIDAPYSKCQLRWYGAKSQNTVRGGERQCAV
jgi:hypothetical protein